MTHDANEDPGHSSQDRSLSDDRSSTSGEKPSGERPSDEKPSSEAREKDGPRKPFVKPEIRREAGVVDGTAGQFSNMNGD